MIPAAPAGTGARALLRDGAVSLALLLALRLVWSHLGAPSGSLPHPFWIVVVLAAAQGGLAVGLLTAVMATALMGWPEREIGTDVLAHYGSLSGTPLMWVLTAIVLGGYRQAQIGIETDLRTENAALHRDAETLAAEIARLDAAIRRMELSALTRLSAGDEAIAALAELGRSDAEARAGALCTAAGLLTRHPGYVLRDGRATPSLQWGFPGSYVPSDPGGTPGVGPLYRPVAGYSCAARQAFPGGELVLLTEDLDTARAEQPVAAVLAQAVERSLAAARPAARLVRVAG